jgi:hypothetical protein
MSPQAMPVPLLASARVTTSMTTRDVCTSPSPEGPKNGPKKSRPHTAHSPGRVDRRGAVTCWFLSQHRVRPEGFEPPTF